MTPAHRLRIIENSRAERRAKAESRGPTPATLRVKMTQTWPSPLADGTALRAGETHVLPFGFARLIVADGFGEVFQ